MENTTIDKSIAERFVLRNVLILIVAPLIVLWVGYMARHNMHEGIKWFLHHGTELFATLLELEPVPEIVSTDHPLFGTVNRETITNRYASTILIILSIIPVSMLVSGLLMPLWMGAEINQRFPETQK